MRIEDVEVASLQVDPKYQRALGNLHVDRLVQQFNPAALGEIDVSERKNGEMFVIDGHHRWIACKRVGHKKMQARVHKGLSSAQEASLFLDLNFTRSVTPGAKYNARMLMDEPDALAITAAVEAEGFTIDPTRAVHGQTVAGISKLDHIYKNYGSDTIQAVLRVTKFAWPTDPKGREATMLGGIARFLVTYPNTGVEALGRKLGQSTLQELTQSRRAYKKDYGISTDAACARAIWHQFNRGRRGNKLPNLFDK